VSTILLINFIYSLLISLNLPFERLSIANLISRCAFKSAIFLSFSFVMI